MTEEKSHLFLPSRFIEPCSFTTPFTGRSKDPREVDRVSHGRFLSASLHNALEENEKLKQDQQDAGLPTRDGAYVTFTIDAEHLSKWESFDSTKPCDISFCTAKPVDSHSTEITVHIPNGKASKFLKKFDEFTSQNTGKGKPKHQSLVANILQISETILEKSIWQDHRTLIPKTTSAWCEIWLRLEEHKNSQENYETVGQEFFSLCETLSISHQSNQWLKFPERLVVLVQANLEGLKQLLLASDRIAEIRAKREPVSFFISQTPKEQSEWAKDLLDRVSHTDQGIAVCIIDSGINLGHPLLDPVIGEKDLFAAELDWPTGDNSRNPHGTLMAGIATYGSLKDALENRDPISINHRLTSIKLLPDQGQNEPFYGPLTQKAIHRYLAYPDQETSIFCMAITETTYWGGRPTSWSAAIDQLAYGSGDMEVTDQKLLLISAGNIHPNEYGQYPDSNRDSGIQSPAQAWNALTVGAYTELIHIEDQTFSGYQPVAQVGGLSPFSRTSVGWDDPNKWPNKPDIVMEGGNMLEMESYGELTRDTADDLSLLTTAANTSISGLFTTINATSAATALASNLAAKIQVEYPDAWPETIRALMVHTAEWTDQMKKDLIGRLSISRKTDVGVLLRYCGYGVPNEARALHCATDDLTLIAQRVIQPYEIKHTIGPPKRKDYKSKDMDLFELPWPIVALKGLGEQNVTLKVTLSFFIEPGPGERGWNNRYRYASHGFRFDVKRPTETENEFLTRVNKEAELSEVEEENDHDKAQEHSWIIGTKNRNRGTVQSDWFTCTAQELATCNQIAVYPIVGWWRERHHLGKVEQKAKYSLVVSIKSDETEIDLYTPVQTQIAVKVATPIGV